MAVSVSVVIPVYNGERYIRSCLDSVLAQTFRDYEIVVVDDGSKDRTPEILEEYTRGIEVLKLDHVGLSRALNIALDRISGEYLCYLACDDLWVPRKMEVELSHLQGLDYGLAYDDYYILLGNSSTVRRNLVPSDVEKGGTFNISASMIAMGALREMKRRYGYYFDERLPSSMDLDLSVRLSRLYRFKHIPEPLAYYRIHPGQMSKGRIQAYSDWMVFKKYNRVVGIGDLIRHYTQSQLLWFTRALFDRFLYAHPLSAQVYRLYNFKGRLRSLKHSIKRNA